MLEGSHKREKKREGGMIRHGHDTRAFCFHTSKKRRGGERDRGGWRMINEYNSAVEVPKFDRLVLK